MKLSPVTLKQAIYDDYIFSETYIQVLQRKYFYLTKQPFLLLNIFRFCIFIHRTWFWHLNYSNLIKALEDVNFFFVILAQTS